MSGPNPRPEGERNDPARTGMVEALATRLAVVSMEAMDQITPEEQQAIGFARVLRAGNDAVAAEALRQMQWVRDQCREQVGGAAEDSDERIRSLLLSLAPDDWKP